MSDRPECRKCVSVWGRRRIDVSLVFYGGDAGLMLVWCVMGETPDCRYCGVLWGRRRRDVGLACNG